MKARVNDQNRLHEVYAILYNKKKKERIYLFKKANGANSIKNILEYPHYSLVMINPEIRLDSYISDDFRWYPESLVTFIEPKDNEGGLNLLLRTNPY